jgi:hypothetical protein
MATAEDTANGGVSYGSKFILNRSRDRMQADNSTQASASLGQLISEHGLRRELRLVYQYLGLAGVIGALVLFVIGVWRAYLAFQHYGPALVWRWSTPSWIAAAVIGTIGLGSLFSLWRWYDLKIFAHANGMTIERKQKRSVYFWRHVRVIRTISARYLLPSLGTKSRSEVQLIFANRKTLRLTHLVEGLGHLVETIKERVYPRLMGDYVKAFRLGKAIKFGPLILTLDSIKHRRRSIPWDQVRGTEIAHGKLNIHWEEGKRKSRLSIPTKKIPNVEICFQLIRRLGLHP